MFKFLNQKGRKATAEADFRQNLRRLRRYNLQQTGLLSEAQKRAAALVKEYGDLEGENEALTEKIAENSERMLRIKLEIQDASTDAGIAFAGFLGTLAELKDVDGAPEDEGETAPPAGEPETGNE